MFRARGFQYRERAWVRVLRYGRSLDRQAGQCRIDQSLSVEVERRHFETLHHQ